MDKLLELQHVTQNFAVGKKRLFGKKQDVLRAVDDVSFTLGEKETLGIVGESGSGKSTLARCILGLYPDAEGSILYRGEDVLEADPKRLKEIRRDVQMIFQDPYSSLNPQMSAREIVMEPLVNLDDDRPKASIRKKAEETLELCGLSQTHFGRFPHEFSGGQRQRIGIARALVLEPTLILADEPTSALDVSIQAQIINLLEELQQERNLSYLFISHDIAVVEHIADRIGVMYRGKLVELADRDEIMNNPEDPYTQKLLSAVPPLDPHCK
ncbi:MAG: ATP-binding cassette domain-containing protein [Peptoniphilus sp.]|nr:ATP-binding cassette domain-containing protein [Peptoniphilus sp.]MDD7363785.1 ATP-binding cassette domain-containing protein [Bacillota bacterium]MDY6044626.1 ATP-binding cassette domain-containing protein [Peptoniphilus sp.]